MILRGIFHIVSRFPLHFMLYRVNLDYFLDRIKFDSVPSYSTTLGIVYTMYCTMYCTLYCIFKKKNSVSESHDNVPSREELF